MLRLAGASPAVGIVAGIVLLAIGLSTGGAGLAVAGGFVLVASAVRMFTEHGGSESGSRDRDGRGRGF